MKVTQPEFGERLRTRRIASGLSQKALAGDVVTPSYISLLERGDRVPTLDVVVHLAQALDTTLDELLGGDARELLAPGDGAGHGELTSQLEARRFVETGDLAPARQILESRIAARRDRGEPYLELGVELSGVLAAMGEHADRLALLEELVALPAAQQLGPVRAALQADLAVTLRELGRLWDARVAASAALTTATEAGMTGGAEHVRLLGVLSSVLCELGEFDSAEPVVAELLARAEQVGRPGVIGRAHWLASMAYARMKRLDLARRHLTQVSRSLSYATLPTLDWLRLCRSTAGILLELGDLDAAREWLDAAEVTARMAGLAGEQAAVARERARYELARGNPAAAAELYRSATEGESSLAGLDLVTALLGRSEAMEQLGEYEEAVALLRRAAQLCDETGNFRQAAEAWRRIDQLRLRDEQPRRPTRGRTTTRRAAARRRS